MPDNSYTNTLAALEAPARFSRANAADFLKGLEALDRYEGEGLLIKTEHDWLKAAFNNAFEKAWQTTVREPFFNDGRYKERTFAEQELESKLGLYPQTHTVSGYLKKVEKATAADGPMRTAMLSILRELVHVGARVVAAKALIGKRPPSKTSKTAIAQAERDAKAMTCQCCGRGILAETGVIAHHGFERPGTGWQTDSCYGARELPFEVSRDALGTYIEMIKQRIVWANESHARVEAEQGALTLRFRAKDAKRSMLGGGYEETVIAVTRATFDAAYAEYLEKVAYRHSPDPTFDRIKAATLRQIESELKHLEQHRVQQQARYDGWSQTHERAGDLWVTLAAKEPT